VAAAVASRLKESQISAAIFKTVLPDRPISFAIWLRLRPAACSALTWVAVLFGDRLARHGVCTPFAW
jgi:hypothetical protein